MNKKLGVIGIGVFGACMTLLYWGMRENHEPPVVEKAERVREVNTAGLPNVQEWAAEPNRDLDEGIALAKKRGAAMRELIRTHPEQAILEALTLSEWSVLPPEIQAEVEQPFSAVANVEVLISCGSDSSETTITTAFLGAGTIETFVYGRRNGLGSKIGTPVQGIRIGEIGALREAIFQSLDAADEAAALALFPVAVADPGGYSVAALAGGRVFYFKNRAAFNEANTRLAALEELPGPNAGAQALFETLEGGIDFEALEEIAVAASMAWTGSPRDMYVILVDFPDRTGQPTDPVALLNSVNTTVSQQIWDMSYEKTHIICTVNPTTHRMSLGNAAYTDYDLLFTEATNAVAGVNLSSYETICVFHPAIDGTTYSGLASVGGSRMWLTSSNLGVIIHELGHNYGARHANSWLPTNGDPVDPAGKEIGYGDFTDIMGWGPIPEAHFNAWHKRHINWFDAENWQAVNTSGIYRVYRSDHRETTGLLRGIEIQKGGDDQYWVGFRQEFTEHEFFSRGAYIVWKMAGDNQSDLLDMTPLSAGGKEDGGLALGQTFSDPVAAVHITPTARGGQSPNEWMDIAVNLGSFPGNSAPAASLAGPTNLTVQASGFFSVTASDTDGDELAYYWDIGDGLIKANTANLSVTWLSGSTVTVSCVVSDMKGGTTTVSQSVVLSSSLENWTQRTSGTTEDLEDIAYGGGRLVAVGTRSTTYSDDGTTWTKHNDGTPWMGNAFLRGIIYDGTQFVACGMNNHSGWVRAVFTSPDGTHWTERYTSSTSPGNTYFNDIAYGGGVYVAVGDDGAIVRSTDGTSWATNASGTVIDLDGVSYGNGTFVAVGADGGGPAIVLASTNGLSWTNYSDGVDLSSWKGFYDVQYCNDRFLAGGWYARIMGSSDSGKTFTTPMTGDRQVIPAFAYGDGTYFAAGVNKDDGNADVNLISLDGANWTTLATASQDDRNAAIFYNGTFITVGDNGAIWQSDAVGATALGFANWQLQNGAALGLNRDALDDADFDGSLNLTEYALGSSATDAGAQPTIDFSSTGIYFQVSYGRTEAKSDIDYTVERAGNLVSNDWDSANTVTLEDSATNLTVRSTVTIATQTNEFMRLNLELK